MPQIKIILDSQVASTLMSCARLTDLRFNQNWTSANGKSNALECGSLAHCILEFSNKAIIDGAMRADAIKIGFDAGIEYITGFKPENKYVKDPEDKGLKNTPEESDGKKIGWQYVLDTMKQYFDYYKSDNFSLISAEEVRHMLLYEDEELAIIWKAKFDLIYDGPHSLMSRDYKTMSQRRDTISLNNQFIGQCALLKSRSIMIDKIGWQTSLKPHEKFIRGTVSYSPDRIAEWRNEIIPHYARMLIAYTEANYFPPNFTHCESKYGLCMFKEICESDRNSRDAVLNMNFVKGKVWDITNDQ